MSMGSLNMKLMQGIEEAENQMQKEKQTQKVGKQEKVENETRDNQRAVGKPQSAKRQPGNMQKQVFSFRAILSDIVIWKAYAVASGNTMEDICNAAMHEYLRRHKLAGAEQAIFDAIKARDGAGR